MQRIIKPDIYHVWLRQLFDCAVKSEELRNNIYAGNYKIIPTQSCLLKPITEVYSEETEIDEYYKDLCDVIDGYVSIHKCLDIRSKLISKYYDLSGIDGIHAFDVSKVGSHIQMGTRSDYTRQYLNACKAAMLMGACCSDERIYRTYKNILKDMPEPYKPKLKLHENVWENSHRYLTYKLQERFSNFSNRTDSLETIIDRCGGEENAVEAINCFHELWEEYSQSPFGSVPVLIENSDGSISLECVLPNSAACVINDNIDDRLRDIYRRIVTDGADIIDKRIIVGKSMQIRKMDELRAASLIGNKITAELKEGSIFNKPKEFQLACSLLMRWINSNEKKAFELFPAYASKEDRMQLMTPEAAAELSDELDRYNELIKEHGCNSFEELVQKMTELITQASEPINDYTEWYGDFGYDPLKNNLDDVLTAIGNAGEKIALELLRQQYGENAEIIPCNTDAYKQQGYDIIVNAGGETYYYEVKTRTRTSMYRHSLNFSRSQAALFRSKNYRVLLIVINKQYELSSSVEFSDLFDCFESGSFTRSDGYSVIV